MIKDMAIIRKELIGFSEVEMPYDFQKDCHIKYVTRMNEDEVFNIGGKFIGRCNDMMIIHASGSQRRVPICIRDKEGNVKYESRFFIPDNRTTDDEQKDDQDDDEKNDIIMYQQSIIEKLIERIKEVELRSTDLSDTITTYEGLLQEGRFKLKDMAVELREKTVKVNHYEEMIPKLYNAATLS
tara:strand:+ start:117 stop:665 length:549 start_codon:yes stop_codon:yes gene_type:complete